MIAAINRSSAARLLAILAAAVTWRAAPALGCAACFAASNQGTLQGFYLSTVLLTAMPFLIVAAFLLYARHERSSRRDQVSGPK